MILPYRDKGSLLINGSLCGKETHLAFWAVLTDMETHAVRRPVKGGPARQGLTGMAAQRYRAGGPGVPRTPGRRPPHRNGGTFGSFSHERTTMQREVEKKKAAKLSRQVSCTATPARPIKRKCSAGGGAGCGDSCGVRAAGKPARPILATCAARRGAGLPAARAAGQELAQQGRARDFPRRSRDLWFFRSAKEQRPPLTAVSAYWAAAPFSPRLPAG